MLVKKHPIRIVALHTNPKAIQTYLTQIVPDHELKLHQVHQPHPLAPAKKLLNTLSIIRPQPAQLHHQQPLFITVLLDLPEGTLPQLLEQQSTEGGG